MKIDIDENIITVLKEKMKDNSEFDDIQKYVNFILKQVTDKINSDKPNTDLKDNEELVKDRLRRLGYLD